MPSLLPGFEHDIFVSYRLKDNRGERWVTNFVEALKTELESTFKEDLSVYFDENPNFGLLETHDVDKSLEGKLKCLVFIAVLSRTYCDPKSYAWQQEFCTFNRLALADEYGRDIKLRGGNVASRILPVMIHDLDPEDRNLIEDEIKSKIRAVDFIFRSPGVNRPLRKDDKREESVNKLFYRDQINKVANAIKEIIDGIRFPDRVQESYLGNVYDDDANYAGEHSEREHPSEKDLNDNSIAVLPFVSLAQDASQDYFADGITENILIQLASMKNLRVISRTSVMRYKKTTKTAPEIADELGVKYILEGSAQSHGNKVRINAQLIDAQKDSHVWSKVFVESMDDIFTIQTNVAEVVAKELKSSLDPQTDEKLKEIPTKNLEAYDLFLKGRHAFNQWSVTGYKIASEYFKKALEKDPEFKQAYSYLASSYSARMSWNGDLAPGEALQYINTYLEEAWKRGATDNDYLTKAFVEFFVNKDFEASEKLLLKAIDLVPNNATVVYTYSYLLCMMGRLEEAAAMISKGNKIEPHSVAYFNYQGICLYLMGHYDEAIATWKEALNLFPQVIRFYDHLGRVYLTAGQYKQVIEAIGSGFRSSSFRPPSMVAYLAAAHVRLNESDRANELLKELLQRSKKGEKGVNVYIIHVYVAMGDMEKALEWLKKAEETNDIDLIWRNVDPLLETLNEEALSGGKPASKADFVSAEKFILSKLQKELPESLHYHNVDHVKDVVESALIIAREEQVSPYEIRLLRIAALYHDAGFINSSRNHEEIGCMMARDTLPSYGFSPEEVDTICGMIMATRIPQSPKNLLERILCDADLDYLGRDDFFETGRRLYDEMKERGIVETEREWNLIQKTFLENHRYHTRYGKANREEQKQKYLQQIISGLLR
jgi:TolB-like protein/Tfp pilus assembly protein PilF/HD superfamily phosphodiesterase